MPVFDRQKEKGATVVCTSARNSPRSRIERRRSAGNFWLRCAVIFKLIRMSYER